MMAKLNNETNAKGDSPQEYMALTEPKICYQLRECIIYDTFPPQTPSSRNRVISKMWLLAIMDYTQVEKDLKNRWRRFCVFQDLLVLIPFCMSCFNSLLSLRYSSVNFVRKFSLFHVDAAQNNISNLLNTSLQDRWNSDNVFRFRNIKYNNIYYFQ